MRVRALVSFAGKVGVNTLSIARGAEFDLPDACIMTERISFVIGGE